VKRGVFRKLTVKEMVNYLGPVNYIITVKVFVNRPYSTMPLPICINSSIKKLLQSGKSLNDCLK
jgi:hypothetical protein